MNNFNQYKIGLVLKDKTPDAASSNIDPATVAELMKEINDDIETGRDKDDDSVPLAPKQSSSNSKVEKDWNNLREVLKSVENELGFEVESDDLKDLKKAGFKVDESILL